MERYVYLITDYIEDFVELVSKNALDNLKLTTCSMAELFELVAKDKELLNRKNTLIAACSEILNDEQKETINSFFYKNFKIYKPSLLYICRNNRVGFDIMERVTNEGNGFFALHDDVTPASSPSIINFIGLLETIFHKMLSSYRIDDYIEKSFQIIVDSKIIEKQKLEIERLYRDLESMSKVDSLTNVLNRKAFFESIESEQKRTLRDLRRMKDIRGRIGGNGEFEVDEKYRSIKALLEKFGGFSCLMLDIDHFKSINDNYGHLVGDDVLKKIGELLTTRNIFREADIIGRYGGEEFIVGLPETNSFDAIYPAERLRKQIKELIFKDFQGKEFGITVSIGISEFYPEDENITDIIGRADRALYMAKERGRDRIVIFEKLDAEY